MSQRRGANLVRMHAGLALARQFQKLETTEQLIRHPGLVIRFPGGHFGAWMIGTGAQPPVLGGADRQLPGAPNWSTYG